MKKNREAWGDFEGIIHPVFRCSSMNALQVSISWGLRGYILAILGVKSGFRSMTWSYGQWGGSWLWVFSENTSSKSLHQSGRVVSWGLVSYAICMEIVIFPIFSPASQAFRFSKQRAVLRSASIPNHRRMYLCGTRESVQEGRHSWRGTPSLLPIGWGMVTCLVIQLITGFHFFSQGIPRIICFYPRFRTMRWMFSMCLGNLRSMWVSQVIFPLELVVLSTL